jgi:cysteinyl-tRNA synthetase
VQPPDVTAASNDAIGEERRATSIRLRDTRTGDLLDLGDTPTVSLYVCGITPYDVSHLGHAFTFVQFDTLVRALEWLGREVVYVQNVTDVDDSILGRSRELGVNWRELGEGELARHLTEMDRLNVRRPTELVRATAVIREIQAIIEELVERGSAYPAVGGTVFFRTRSAAHFGELSKLGRDEMLRIAGEQDDADLDDPRKEDPLDVALWKAWSGDANEPHWDSPWGPGRPGWTIECAAINRRFIGPQVDLHGGGADLVFPHHETETALMESATGVRPFVWAWLHVGMVHYDGAKMSKSLGNLVFIPDLVERVGPDAVRLLLLSHHYREDWEYTDGDLAAAAERSQRLRTRFSEPDVDDGATAEFQEALESDFDLPLALAALDRAAGPTLRRLAGVLGLHLAADG